MARTASDRRIAFTLVELLMVIAIIGVLAALLLPAINIARRKALESSTSSLIHQCEVGAQAFFDDYGDYPPSTFAELARMFKKPTLLQGLDLTTSPDTVNEGIEVFVAALATQFGGAYLELDDSLLRNTDGVDATGAPAGDLDTDMGGQAGPDVREAVNWYFGGNDVFEVVDRWGNPLVYFHNRDYAAHDGLTGAGTWEAPPTPASGHPRGAGLPADWAGKEAVPYADAAGNVGPCYARSTRNRLSGQYPNLTGFQLYSWGYDQLPGCGPLVAGAPNENVEGIFPGWTGRSGNLFNWEE